MPELGDLAARFSEGLRPTLEAQICNLADEIAYNNHDIDDGLRSGLLSIDELMTMDLFSRHVAEVKAEFPDIGERRTVHETIRRMIGALVGDLLAESARRIQASGVATLDDVRRAPTLIGFTPAMKAENANLKRFLLQNLYRHPRVVAMTDRAGRIVSDLFAGFMAEPARLPAQYQKLAEADKARTIGDYIAGMTDRYAIREHGRLCGPTEAADTAALWEHAGHGY